MTPWRTASQGMPSHLGTTLFLGQKPFSLKVVDCPDLPEGLGPHSELRVPEGFPALTHGTPQPPCACLPFQDGYSAASPPAFPDSSLGSQVGLSFSKPAPLVTRYPGQSALLDT